MHKIASPRLAAVALTASVSFAQKQDVNEANYQILHIQPLPNEGYQSADTLADNNVYVAGLNTAFNRTVEYSIYILDGRNLQITYSIAVSKNLPFGIALNKKTQTLYVRHSFLNVVSAWHLKTKKYGFPDENKWEKLQNWLQTAQQA